MFNELIVTRRIIAADRPAPSGPARDHTAIEWKAFLRTLGRPTVFERRSCR